MSSQKHNTLAARTTTRRSRDDETGLSTIAAPAACHDVSRGGRSSSSRKTVAERRHETLRRYRRLLKNHTAAVAARKVGASVPTIWRWQKLVSARGVAGLQPKNFKAGRRSPFEQVRLTPQALRELELLHVEHVGNAKAAWRQFAQFNPNCPLVVASYVQRRGRPPGPLAGLGRVTGIQARCYVSADGRRLFVKPPVRGILTAKLTVPGNVNLVRVKL